MIPKNLLRIVVFCTFFAAVQAYAAPIPFTDATAAELSMTSEPKAPGAPAIILSYEESDDSVTAEVLVHVRIKVLTEGGIAAGNIPLPSRIVTRSEFESQFTGRTIHPDGTIVPLERSVSVITNDERLVVAMPQVQIGSIIEYAYKLPDRNNLTSYLYSYTYQWYAPMWIVQQKYFVRSARFSLKAPTADKELTHWVAKLPPGSAPRQEKDRITLELTDIPATPDEEEMPPASATFYQVRFFYYSDSRDTYWGRTADSVQRAWAPYEAPRKVLVQAIPELVKPGDKDEDKLKQIYLKVVSFENTDYTRKRSDREDKVLGGRRAQTSEDVWNLKRGDSYELTLLFVALSRAAGFNASPMAVASRGQALFDINVLSWEQTDSLIAVIALPGHDLYLDPGSPGCPFGDLAPWHAHVTGISIDGKSAKFRTTPENAGQSSRLERTADLTLARDGSVSGTIHLTWQRLAGIGIREQALSQDEQAVRAALTESIQAQLPNGVEVNLRSIGGLLNYEVPLEADFTASGTLGTVTAKRVIVPAQLFASKQTPRFVAETRTQPISFANSYVTSDKFVLHLPADLTIESVPKVSKISVGKFAGFTASVLGDPSDPHILTTQRLDFMERIDYPQQDYAPLRGYFAMIANADQQQLMLHIAAAENKPVQ